MIHRARLHAALAALTPPNCVHFGKKLVAIEQNGAGVTLTFADGSRVEAMLVIGADGIHSVVREALFGAEQPHFTGRVAYRTTYPTARIDATAIDERAKWWGPDRHVVHYFTTASRDEIYFIAVTPEPISRSNPGRCGRQRHAARGLCRISPARARHSRGGAGVRKWALVERDPMPSWGNNNVVLLGDACHPMPPYMAQGAASAIEDAVVLARCLDQVAGDDISTALAVYAASRKERTARMQLTNRENTWLRQKTDTDWVYEYDAWRAPLA